MRDQNKWHCRAQPSCHQATCRYVFRQMLQRQYYVMLIMVTCSSLAAIATARSVPITKSLTVGVCLGLYLPWALRLLPVGRTLPSVSDRSMVAEQPQYTDNK